MTFKIIDWLKCYVGIFGQHFFMAWIMWKNPRVIVTTVSGCNNKFGCIWRGKEFYTHNYNIWFIHSHKFIWYPPTTLSKDRKDTSQCSRCTRNLKFHTTVDWHLSNIHVNSSFIRYSICSLILVNRFSKYTEIGRHRGIVANELIKIGSNYCEKVKTFKYLASLLTNQNSIQEEIKCRLSI